jgi:hypothetical protein
VADLILEGTEKNQNEIRNTMDRKVLATFLSDLKSKSPRHSGKFPAAIRKKLIAGLTHVLA